MNFNVTLKRKTMEGTEAVLNFEPVLNFAPVDSTICACDSIIVKVPITAQGYFIDSVYTVTIAPFVAEVTEETVV